MHTATDSCERLSGTRIAAESAAAAAAFTISTTAAVAI